MAALSSTGWSIPDAGLAHNPPPVYVARIRAAVAVLEVGGTDREAWRAFCDVDVSTEAVRALEVFDLVCKAVERQRRAGIIPASPFRPGQMSWPVREDHWI